VKIEGHKAVNERELFRAYRVANEQTLDAARKTHAAQREVSQLPNSKDKPKELLPSDNQLKLATEEEDAISKLYSEPIVAFRYEENE